MKGKPLLAKAKTVFCHGFLDLVNDVQELDRAFNQGHIEGKHHTFNIGQELPKFRIEYFTGSHGLAIYADGSHPRCLEVAESKPFWLDELHEIGTDFRNDMKEHMALIDMIRQYQLEVTKPSFLTRALKRLKAI